MPVLCVLLVLPPRKEGEELMLQLRLLKAINDTPEEEEEEEKKTTVIDYNIPASTRLVIALTESNAETPGIAEIGDSLE